MTTPMPLLVPPPTFAFAPVAGTAYAPLERAVAVTVAPVRFPDGSAMTADELVVAQAQLLRVSTPGAPPELWDAAAGAWRAPGGAEAQAVAGLPLVPPAADGAPWTGVLLALAVTSAAGAPQVVAATPFFPQYRLRGVFRARRGAIEAAGIGVESAPLAFASAEPPSRLVAELSPEPATATRLRISLVDAGARPLGRLEIDASGATASLTLATFDSLGGALASLTLESDGTIRLAPAPGRKVVLAGDVEAERVRYLPSGGGAKQDLV